MKVTYLTYLISIKGFQEINVYNGRNRESDIYQHQGGNENA